MTCSSGNPGMFRHHSTALKRSRAANSQMLSIPIMFPGWGGGGGGGGDTNVGVVTGAGTLVESCG